MIKPVYDPLLDIFRAQDASDEAGKLKYDPILEAFRMADTGDGFNVDPVSLQLRHGALLNQTPDAPTGLVSTVVSDSQVNLSWNAVDGVDAYKVYYGISTGNYTLNATSATNSKSITGLSQSTIYYFVVVALIGTNESALSNETFNLTLATSLVSADTFWYKWDDLSTITKDVNNKLSKLADKNGSGNDLEIVSSRYAEWSNNGVKIIDYAGLVSVLNKVFTLEQPCEVYVSMMLPTWVSNRRILMGGSGDGTYIFRQAVESPKITSSFGFAFPGINFPLNEFHVAYSCANNASFGDVFGVDNVELTGQDFGLNDPGGISIGGNAGGYGIANAVFREIVVRRVLSDQTTRHAIRDYLIKRNDFFFNVTSDSNLITADLTHFTADNL